MSQSSPLCWCLKTKHTLFFQDQGTGSTRCPAQPKEIQEGWGNVVISSNPAGKLCARSLVLIQPSIFGIPGSLLPGPAVSLWRALRGGGGGVIKTHRQGHDLAHRKHSAPHPTFPLPNTMLIHPIGRQAEGAGEKDG